MKSFVLFSVLAVLFAPAALAIDSPSTGNYLRPEWQSGFNQEQYEIRVGRKFQRGAENFVLSGLEIPHNIKQQMEERKSEYLPVGIESYAIGTVRGIGRGFLRAGVGLFEMVTSLYPQEPILEEMDEWLY